MPNKTTIQFLKEKNQLRSVRAISTRGCDQQHYIGVGGTWMIVDYNMNNTFIKFAVRIFIR